MLKMLRYLKKSTGWVILIMLLLFLQAYCDLSLPDYTSRIINVGVQQKGIEDGVPEKIRRSSMEDLELFMDPETRESVLSFFDEEDKMLVLKEDISARDRKELNRMLMTPMMIMTGLASGGENSLFSVGMPSGAEPGKEAGADGPEAGKETDPGDPGAVQEPGPAFQMDPALFLPMLRLLPEAARKNMLSGIMEKVSQMPETIAQQSAVVYVQKEYEAQGEDLGARQMRYILHSGLQMLLLALIIMIAAITISFLASRVGSLMGHDIRSDVYRKVMSFSSREYHQFSTASLITRCTNDVQQVQMVTALMFRIVLYAPILGIGGVIRVLQTDSSMTWILAVAVGIILLVVLVLFQIVMPRFRMLQSLVDRLNLVTREILSGIPVIRAFGREKKEEERFDVANRELTRTTLFVNRSLAFMMPLMMLIMNGISVTIIYFGARGVDAGDLQVGNMMAFIQYAMQIIMAFLMISVMSIMIPRANVAAGRIQAVLDTQNTILDPEKPKTPEEGRRGEVEFSHVSFAYPDAGENVITDISFKASAGETVAVIGSTGSGKSTLVKLIPRFYDVTEGSITVDGVDVRQMTQKDLRARIGYVPQKGVLFSGTIESNIRYAGEEVTEEKMTTAARIAQAEDFILEKNEQYQAPIAQGGTNVSGGQKQRLSIARAIAKDPEIYIFDDSFSALDFKTDSQLRKALKEYTSKATTIIVAQRISTVLNADQILCLDNGHLAGIGTHKELLESCEVYRQIALSQLSEEEIA